MGDRESLRGFVVIEDWTEDYSDWSGSICFPNPRGSNLHWENPIEFVEVGALKEMERAAKKKDAKIQGIISYCDLTLGGYPEGFLWEEVRKIRNMLKVITQDREPKNGR